MWGNESKQRCSSTLRSGNMTGRENNQERQSESAEEKDWSESAFDMEIEKMSKDADAILESLREVAGASPLPRKHPAPILEPPKTDEKSISLSSFLQTPPNEGPRESYDTDDDMSDTGTVSSLVKRELGNALQEAEREFTAKEEKTAVPVKGEKSSGDNKGSEKIDESLILLMTLVWSLVIFFASVARHYMLNDEGRIVVPFLSLPN